MLGFLGVHRNLITAFGSSRSRQPIVRSFSINLRSLSIAFSLSPGFAAGSPIGSIIQPGNGITLKKGLGGFQSGYSITSLGL